MESLSLAFVQAISAVAGVGLSFRQFDYGIDGTFRPIHVYNRRRLESGMPLDYQLKATTNWNLKNNSVCYHLESKTYNDLTYRNDSGASIPTILILLCLPKDKERWLEVAASQLLLRNCTYWHYIKGPRTKNSSTVKIEIPDCHIFSPDSLLQLLTGVALGKPKWLERPDKEIVCEDGSND